MKHLKKLCYILIIRVRFSIFVENLYKKKLFIVLKINVELKKKKNLIFFHKSSTNSVRYLISLS